MRFESCFSREVSVSTPRALMQRLRAHARFAGVTIVLIANPMFAQRGTPADSGRMRSAYADWHPYTTPSMCLAAVRDVAHLTRRLGPPKFTSDRWLADSSETLASHGGDDMMHVGLYNPVHDTLPNAAVKMGRDCGKHFTAHNVPDDELQALYWLALSAHDDALIQAIISRQLAAAQDVAAKGEVYRDAIEMDIAGYSPRLDLAQASLRQLEALGTAAHVPQIHAHLALARFYRFALADFDAANREADAAIAAGRLATPAELTDGLLLWDVVKAMVEKAKMRLVDNPVGGPAMIDSAMQVIVASGLPEVPAAQQEADAWKSIFPFAGHRVPSLVTPHTFHAPGTHPDTSHLILYVDLRHDWRTSDLHTYQLFEALRRVHQTLGDKVDIVGLTYTVGWTRGSLSQSVNDEVESIRKYLLDYQKLPITLLVYESPVTQIPDGRRINGGPSYWKTFPLVSAGAVVTAPDGTMMGITWNGFYQEGMAINGTLDRLVRKAIARLGKE